MARLSSYLRQMSRRSPHLEVIWPETAKRSSMRRRTLHDNKNKINMGKDMSGMKQALYFLLKLCVCLYIYILYIAYVAQLTNCRDEHDTEANEYGKLVSNPSGRTRDKHFKRCALFSHYNYDCQ